MSKLLFIVVMVIGLAFFGCGEQADQADNGGDSGEAVSHDVNNGEDSGETVSHGDTESHGTAGSMDFDLNTPEMAVGQWIEYGADTYSGTLTISVVGTEINQGTECYWVQLEASDFVAQLLVDPAGIENAMGDYKDQFGTFVADPAGYIRENMSDSGNMADMFGSSENINMAIELISAIRMVKYDQQGQIMAIDLAGVPEFLTNLMQDPSIQEQFKQGFEQGFNSGDGQENLDTIISELDNMQFNMNETDVDVAGNTLHGMEFSIVHPEGEAKVVISSELPLIPLAYAEITGDGETFSIEVRGYSFSGAENLLPGEPAQTLPALMFLQGMQQQAGAAGAQGRGMN